MDYYVECDICSERYWLAYHERPNGWVTETETLDGEVVTHCHSCKVTTAQ